MLFSRTVGAALACRASFEVPTIGTTQSKCEAYTTSLAVDTGYSIAHGKRNETLVNVTKLRLSYEARAASLAKSRRRDSRCTVLTTVR